MRTVLKSSAGWKRPDREPRNSRKDRSTRCSYRLEAAGMVEGEWEDEATPRRGPRRRIYRLTKKGQRRFAEARGEFHQFTTVIGGILGRAT